MELMEQLDALQKEALENESLKTALLSTRAEKAPVEAFCHIARAHGYEIYEMDLIQAGEEFYATMRRSTNGGGENSPKLQGEDDFYELFLAGLQP